jgi:hypothetical protein
VVAIVAIVNSITRSRTRTVDTPASSTLSCTASVSPAPLSCQRPKKLEGGLARAQIERERGGLTEEGSDREGEGRAG